MTDVELRSFGKSAAYMCSPEANPGTEPRPVFVLQLEEARAEWRRRHRTILTAGSKRLGVLLAHLGNVLLACRRLLLLGQNLGPNGLEPLLVEMVFKLADGHRESILSLLICDCTPEA